MNLRSAQFRAISIWRRFGKRLDLDDLKAQSALYFVQGKRIDTIYFDLFDYAEGLNRRIMFPLPKREHGATWMLADPWIFRRASELPEQQRRAVRLVYVDGFTQREAASRMGLTEGRVSQILKQALGTLRDRMGAK